VTLVVHYLGTTAIGIIPDSNILAVLGAGGLTPPVVVDFPIPGNSTSIDNKGSSSGVFALEGGAAIIDFPPGLIQKALDVRGNSDKKARLANVADSYDINDAAGPVTAEAWIYPDVLNAGNNTFVGNKLATGNQNGYEFTVLDSGAVNFTATDTTGTVVSITTATALVTTDTLHHVAAVRSNTTDWTIFVDGTAAGTGSQVRETPASGADLTLGSASYTNTEGFDGYIDSFRFSLEALYSGTFTPVAFPTPSTYSVVSNVQAISKYTWIKGPESFVSAISKYTWVAYPNNSVQALSKYVFLREPWEIDVTAVNRFVLVESLPQERVTAVNRFVLVESLPQERVTAVNRFVIITTS
jgi:hypothetical protein